MPATAQDRSILPANLVGRDGELYYLPEFVPAAETPAL
ncbi:MAG: hypothetical protein H6R26_1363, partial [Proteobacteria bacterium]|nr:hypothetical protein [Pseudomonadota bacterium]